MGGKEVYFFQSLSVKIQVNLAEVVPVKSALE